MKCLKLIIDIILIVLIYELIFIILPFIFYKPIYKNKKQQIDKNLCGNQTTDKALLIESPDDAFNIRISMIQEATKSIDIAYNFLEKGITSKVFVNELINAADRGVVVRLLLDGKSAIIHGKGDDTIKFLNSFDNVMVGYYSNISFLRPWIIQTFMHDKIIIVDDEWLLTGGRNIGDRFFAPDGFEESITYDRDILIYRIDMVSYSAVKEAKEYTDSLWKHKDVKKQKSHNMNYKKQLEELEQFKIRNPKFYKKSLENYKDELIDIENIKFIYNPTNTSKKEPWIGYQLKQIIENANDFVLIQTPYTTANKKLLDTLNNVKADKKIMITNSELSSPNYMAFSNYMSNRKKYLNTDFKIFEYQSYNSIHGKSLLVDSDISIIGSFNMDDRSLNLNTENMVIVKGKEFQNQVKEAVRSLQDNSFEVLMDNEYAEPLEQATPLMKKILFKLSSMVSGLFRIFV